MIRRGYVARTWAVPNRLADDVKRLAEELQVNDSQIVVRLLNYGLAAVERGELRFATRIVARELVDDAG